MREEYMIERQGKRFVLYAGLLEEAHARGLDAIETELIQTPAADNGDVAIVKAVVRMKEGGRFDGIGDASVQNVGRMIQPHLIRMAETRAKARALRDAINVGVTAFEELGGDGDADDRQERPPAPARGVRQDIPRQADGDDRRQQGDAERGALPATRKQLNYLEGLVADVVEDGITRFEEMVGKPIGELTRGEASEWIGKLSGRAV